MEEITYKVLHKIFKTKKSEFTEKYVQYRGQEANDLVSCHIQASENGLMVSKFGTVELNAICCLLKEELGISNWDVIRGKVEYSPENAMKYMRIQAGFFPQDVEKGKQFAKLALKDAEEIDVLGSYIRREKYIQDYLGTALNVDLEGYYAPFMWSNPWTKELKGKKVLVIHPFVDTIKKQYEKREKLFENPDVLPEFAELHLLKAVQTIGNGGEKSEFNDWFEALEYMKKQIDQIDYDVALIGCGAYGMSLAAHAKRNKKIAIHLAGWTQMLFGIYGKRWIEDQPKFAKYINEYWVRPSDSEKPEGAEQVERGCYW